MIEIESCSTSHAFVKSSVEGAKRKLVRPVQPSEPLSADTVQAMAVVYVTYNSLSGVRFLFFCLVGFYGFFRADEINIISLKDVAIRGVRRTIYAAMATRQIDLDKIGSMTLLVLVILALSRKTR